MKLMARQRKIAPTISMVFVRDGGEGGWRLRKREMALGDGRLVFVGASFMCVLSHKAGEKDKRNGDY